ncbi:nuclear transport factor 2 family protein [Streptomyces shenzhenensis]|uniref:nuclear transport factor 2 family protein n=1 Tax=Streptomyces shenzhenensis TaxID=943815 RepID=UPI0028682C01|nr:nuclear transport factor 2 family protein [Streptomyces shenzhenensis]
MGVGLTTGSTGGTGDGADSDTDSGAGKDIGSGAGNGPGSGTDNGDDNATRAAVEAYLAALNAHDADAVAACVAEDFVNEHTSSTGQSRRGRAAYRAALTGFLAEFGDLRYVPEHVLVDGARAAVPYVMTFRMRSAGDRPVRIRGVFLFTVAGGLVTHRTDYWDGDEVRRQLA